VHDLIHDGQAALFGRDLVAARTDPLFLHVFDFKHGIAASAFFLKLHNVSNDLSQG
jgi:hypothetical protein